MIEDNLLLAELEKQWSSIDHFQIEQLEAFAASEKKVQATISTKRLGALASEQAARYWHGLQEAGFVDGSCRLLSATTRKQAMYIAESFAEKLGIKSKWKTFERFWGISNLAQEKWDFQQTGASPSRSKEIDQIFRD